MQENEQRTLPPPPPFFLFFETTEICLGSTKMEISTVKKHFTPGKNWEKWLCPPKKDSSYATALIWHITEGITPNSLANKYLNIT